MALGATQPLTEIGTRVSPRR